VIPTSVQSRNVYRGGFREVNDTKRLPAANPAVHPRPTTSFVRVRVGWLRVDVEKLLKHLNCSWTRLSYQPVRNIAGVSISEYRLFMLYDFQYSSNVGWLRKKRYWVAVTRCPTHYLAVDVSAACPCPHAQTGRFACCG